MLIYGTSGWIHLSIGRADRWFRWVVVEFGVTGSSFFWGSAGGPWGLPQPGVASFWILTIPAFWYAGRPIRFGITPVVAAVWKYILASLLAGCASAAIIREILSPDRRVRRLGCLGSDRDDLRVVFRPVYRSSHSFAWRMRTASPSCQALARRSSMGQVAKRVPAV